MEAKKLRRIKVVRNIFLFVAIFITIFYAIALLTGIKVYKYYNACLDKANYQEIELSVTIKDSSISFFNNRTITGPDYKEYTLYNKNEQIAIDNNILAELNEKDTVLVSISPSINDMSYSIVSIQQGDREYLNFEDGWANWLESPRYRVEYFNSGAILILIVFGIIYVILIFFQMLYIRTKSKSIIESPPLEDKQFTRGKTGKHLQVIISIIFVKIFGIAFLIISFIFIFGVLSYSKYSNEHNYVEALCQIVENDGCRDLEIIDQNPQFEYDKNAFFSIISRNLEVAFNNGFYEENEIGDHVMITYVYGDYHGTPLYIAAIKTDSKVYLDLEEGKNNMADWRKAFYGKIIPWFFISLSFCLGSIIRMIILLKKL